MPIENRDCSAENHESDTGTRIGRAFLLITALTALILAGCTITIQANSREVQQYYATATAAYGERTQNIQAMATHLSESSFDWGLYEPCAQSEVRLEFPDYMKAGSSNLIRQQQAIKFGEWGAQEILDVRQLLVSGHQAMPKLNEMTGVGVSVQSPSETRFSYGWDATVVRADRIVQTDNPDNDIISLILIGPSGTLADRAPVGERIGGGTTLAVGDTLFVASLPLGAEIFTLNPSVVTVTGLEGGVISGDAQISDTSATSIVGASGSGACMGGVDVGVVVAGSTRNSISMQITPFTPQSKDLIMASYETALKSLEADGVYAAFP